MKETFLFKLTVVAAFVLHVFGASALVITILALCGVRMNWWIGALSVVPGWLFIRGLTELACHEQYKMVHAQLEEWGIAFEEKQSTGKTELCRFNKDGKCIYSEEPMECVHEEDDHGTE